MITDPELGTIDFVHNERSKHIRVRILASGLKVTMPVRSSPEEAMKFINSIRAKLIQKQEKLEKGLQKSNIIRRIWVRLSAMSRRKNSPQNMVMHQ